METVRMKKGDETVSVRNTPEDIGCAKSQGYVLTDAEPERVKTEPGNGNGENHGAGGTGTGEEGKTGGDSGKKNTGPASLDKKGK